LWARFRDLTNNLKLMRREGNKKPHLDGMVIAPRSM
jgi:hypothetical protein